MIIIYATAFIVALVGVIEYFKSKQHDKSVSKFNEERNAAMALDKELQRVRNESTRETLNYNEAIKRYRAKFGTPKRPKDDPGL